MPVLDLVESVIFCIQVTEDKVNCDASHFGLNAEKILAFQKELVAGVEAKLNEGKKGKDKAAAEGKIDIAAVTEAICLGISSELRKKAVGLYFSLNMVCQRRGCVWDIWEKGCVEELAQLAEVAHIFDMQEGSSAMAIPVHVIVELQVWNCCLCSASGGADKEMGDVVVRRQVGAIQVQRLPHCTANEAKRCTSCSEGL